MSKASGSMVQCKLEIEVADRSPCHTQSSLISCHSSSTNQKTKECSLGLFTAGLF